MLLRSLVASAFVSLALVTAGCGSSTDTTKASSGTSSTSSTSSSTSSSSGAGGAGGGGSGAGGGIVLGEPITAPSEKWTFVPFDDAFCANGSTTGIGINITDKSKGLVIYMEGGGACWSDLTCYQLKTATNIDTGYDATAFQSDATGLLTTSLFDRTDPKNPYKDYSFVFVPYCTGDVHAGTNADALYGGKKTMHVGGTNVQKYLSRIIPTFPDADRVIASGSSAGGFGAAFNFWRVANGFKKSSVYLLDDSGPPLPAPYLKTTLETLWRKAWGLDTNFPADCPACLTSFDALLDYYTTHYTKSRFALLSYVNDNVISSFYSITQAQMAMGLDALATQSFDPYPKQAAYFYITGNKHTLLGGVKTLSQNGVSLEDWITQFNSDDPAWKSVHP
jgi:hypothetical protein